VEFERGIDDLGFDLLLDARIDGDDDVLAIVVLEAVLGSRLLAQPQVEVQADLVDAHVRRLAEQLVSGASG
jgi:hypothetical protein